MENSDDSEFDDEHSENPIASSTGFQKKDDSDSDDSSDSERYFKSFNQESLGQNSNDEDSNEDEQFNKAHEEEATYTVGTANYSGKTEYQDSSGDTENDPTSPEIKAEFRKDSKGIKRRRNHQAPQTKRARVTEFYPATSKIMVQREGSPVNETEEATYTVGTANYSGKTEYQDSSGDTENDPTSQEIKAEFRKDSKGIKRRMNHEAPQTKRAKVTEFYPATSKKMVQREDSPVNETAIENQSSIGRTTKKSETFGSDKAMRMMQKMGYESGHGLGKNKQGRLDPVQAHKQRGYSGFGFRNRGLEKASLQWDPSQEEVKVKEDMEWLENPYQHAPRTNEMVDWIHSGARKDTINDETHFCDPDTVADIMNSKTVFDTLDKTAMRYARTRSNPYETIRGAFFLNRAAVKMANMDKACDMMFTQPPGMQSDELLYFADVCAGPGGFSEYVLWRKKWHAKGFGFTLKNENDFKLSDFYAGPSETFFPFYGPAENGDVFDPKNQIGFKELIMMYTEGKGVHFMMSDGGFSVEGQENIQEILSKQLYLCQCIVALMIVRTQGHFVTKLFDVFTPFSAGLVYLMHRCFDKISIFKPNSSRPANSERYLICKGKRRDTGDVLQHLLQINDLLLKRDKHTDILEIVPLDILKSDEEFMNYLKSSNESLGKKQIIGLLKIAAYCEDNALIEVRQADMRKQCLEYWDIPSDKTRTVPKRSTPQEKLQLLLNKNVTHLDREPTKLTIANIDQVVSSYRDWFFMPCESGMNTDQQCKLYMGMGRRNTYCLENGKWTPNRVMKLELPADTLVYAETVHEHISESRIRSTVPAFHILDAYILGGEDVSKLYIEDRQKLIRKFCQALWKPTDIIRVRAKDLYQLGPRIEDYLRIKPRVTKNGSQALGYDLPKTVMDYSCIHSNETPYFIPKSIVFFKSTAACWSRHFSKTYNTTYVFNSRTNEKHYDCKRPSAAEAHFIESFIHRNVWYWPEDDTLTMNKVVKLLEQRATQI